MNADGLTLPELTDQRVDEIETALFARINPDAARIEVDDKLRFHRRCVALGLPVPTLHAVLCRASDEAITDVPVLRGFSDSSTSKAPSRSRVWKSRNNRVPGTTASNTPSSQAMTGGCQLL